MSRWMRSYYYAVFGAMGGLLAWRIAEAWITPTGGNIYIINIGLGSIIGCLVGFLIGASEDLLRWSLPRIIRKGLIGGVLGAIAGAIGLPLAELVFQATGGEMLGRVLGWTVFGMIIGLSEGVVGGTQMGKGGMGGAVGGAIGGVVLELANQMSDNLVVGKMVGLMLLGACVGAFMALIALLLSRAWIQVRSGKMKGVSFELDKFISARSAPVYIGSDPKCFIYISLDKDVEPEHAMLRGESTHFVLENLSSSGTYVGSSAVEKRTLTNHDVIRVGNTELVYYEKG